jgi:hypothetical protein
MKNRLRDLLAKRQLDEIAVLGVHKKRILGALTSLTFESDPLICWRAVEAIGAAARSIAETNPDFVRQHLRRLHWLVSEESGGVCWYAPQAMAEICRRNPTVFSDYIPIVVTLLDEMAEEDLGYFRSGVLWAIGRVAPVAGDELEPVLPLVIACLEHDDAQIRGLAVWCLLQAGKRDVLAERPELRNDDGAVELYENGELLQTSVRAVAAE